MAYTPTAQDFEAHDVGGYKPSAADFEPSANILERLQAAADSAKLSLATKVAQSPTLSRMLQGAGSAVDPFNRAVQSTPIPALSRGLLQGGGESAAFLGNLPAETINLFTGSNLPTAHMPDLSEFASSQENPLAAGVGEFVGGSILPGAIAGKGIEKVAPLVKKLGSQSLADSLLTRKRSLEDIYRKRYQSIVGGETGQLPTDAPFVNQQLKNALPSGQKSIIARFQNNPTIASAHAAQSDIGKLKNALYSIPKAKRTTIDNENLANADKLQKAIRASIGDAFKASGRPELADAYKAVTKGYGKDVVPFSRNQFINQYERGELEAPYLMKRLAGSSKSAQTFRNSIGQNAPELQTFKKLQLAKKVVPISALLALPGFHFIKELI